MATRNRTVELGWGLKSLIATVLVIALGFGIYLYAQAENQSQPKQKASVDSVSRTARDIGEFLDLSEDAVSAMQLKSAIAVIPRYSKVLRLRGSLAIDSNRLSHVHARFPGQIVELATINGLKSRQPDSQTPAGRALQHFDEVEKGVPMAVIWSKDLGEKKSQLADSLARLHTDKITLANLRTLAKKGGVSDRDLREQKVKVEQGIIAAFTAEATLHAYQVTDADIKQVKDAAEKMHRRDESDNDYEQADKDYSAEWPVVVVYAPIGGVIVDKSVTVGEIVDANANLFKIADLSVLAVWLHPYEEDLPALESLPKPLKVSIKIPAHPELGELECEVDRFSPMIDPNEHMALLIGTVQNPKRALLAGQFITAEVGIPTEKGVVEIPTNAMIDFGMDAVVFVQPDRSKPRFQRRRVQVVQRYFDVVHVRSELTDDQTQQGIQEIHAGDAVVAGGILELEDYSQQR